MRVHGRGCTGPFSLRPNPEPVPNVRHVTRRTFGAAVLPVYESPSEPKTGSECVECVCPRARKDADGTINFVATPRATFFISLNEGDYALINFMSDMFLCRCLYRPLAHADVLQTGMDSRFSNDGQ